MILHQNYFGKQRFILLKRSNSFLFRVSVNMNKNLLFWGSLPTLITILKRG